MKGKTNCAPLDDESIVLLRQLQDRLEGVRGERDRRWWSILAMIVSYHDEHGCLPKKPRRRETSRLWQWICDVKRKPKNFTPGTERAEALAALGIVPQPR